MKSEVYSLFLKPCTCEVLDLLLERRGYVWIAAHAPDPNLRWWRADVPLSPGDVLEGALVRYMTYDRSP